MENNPSDIRDRIRCEKSTIPWKELQRFFASGSVIYIDSHLDLVDVALHMHEDKHEVIKEWMKQGMIAKVSDDQARRWFAADAQVVAVVVRPWVLVQDVITDEEQDQPNAKT